MCTRNRVQKDKRFYKKGNLLHGAISCICDREKKDLGESELASWEGGGLADLMGTCGRHVPAWKGKWGPGQYSTRCEGWMSICDHRIKLQE